MDQHAVAIVGSRDWPFPEMVQRAVQDLHAKHGAQLVIVSGGARGVDRYAVEVAQGLGIRCIVHKPDWDLWGRSAGFVRNQYIVDDADEMIAFHFQKSRGTWDSVNKAHDKGIPVNHIEVY